MTFPPTVVSMAIEPRSQADRDKLTDTLAKLAREDPTFDVRHDPETAQLVVSGMGELHLEVIKHRLLEDFGVDANVGEPRVAYKETIRAEAEAEARIEQQTGQRGTFAVVRLKVAPAELGGQVEFHNCMRDVTPPKIKRRFAAAIEAGARDTAKGGIVTGFPMINVAISLLDADEHPVDSDDVAFEAAAAMAVRMAVEKAGANLLEPIMSLEVVAPAQYLGDIIADLNSRRFRHLRCFRTERSQRNRGKGPAVGNVRIRHRFKVAHPGARHLYPGTQRLSSGPQKHLRTVGCVSAQNFGI